MSMVQIVTYGFTTVEDPISNGGLFTTVADSVFTGNMKVPSSGICEPHAIIVNDATFYSGAVPVGDTGGTWPSDQYAEGVLTTLAAGSSAFASFIVRQQAFNSGTQYILNVANGSYQFFAVVSGSVHALTSALPISSFSSPETWRLSVTGNVLTATRNGSALPTFTDSNNYIPSGGSPGFGGSAGTAAITNLVFSSFSAGGNQCTTPTFSPVAGTYTGTQTITITGQASSTIYYTTNGSTPTRSSASIASGSTITINSSCTVKAICSLTNFVDSAVGSATYNLSLSPFFGMGLGL